MKLNKKSFLCEIPTKIMNIKIKLFNFSVKIDKKAKSNNNIS